MKMQTDMTIRDWARAVFWTTALALLALFMLGALPMGDSKQSAGAASVESIQFSLDKTFEHPARSVLQGAPVELVPFAGGETVAVYEERIVTLSAEQKSYDDFTSSHPAWPGTGGSDGRHSWTGAVAQAGKVVAAGRLELRDSGVVTVARFQADGSLDATFGKAGMVLLNLAEAQSSRATSLAVDASGRLLVAGLAGLKVKAENQVPETRVFLARFLVNGQPDRAFGREGIVLLGANDNIEDFVGAQLVLLPDERMLLLAGRALVNENKTSARAFPWIRRLAANGSIDRRFGDPGKRIHVDPTGEGFAPFRMVYSKKSRSIFIVGAERIGGTDERAGNVECSVVKLTAEGRRDSTFGDNGGLLFMPQGGAGNCGFSNAVELENGDLLAGGFVAAEDAKFGSGEVFFLKHIPGNLPPGTPLGQSFQFLRKTSVASSPTSRRAPMFLDKDRLTVSSECTVDDRSRDKIGECEHGNILFRLKRDKDAPPIMIGPLTQKDSAAAVLAAIRKKDFNEYKTSIDDCGDSCRKNDLVYRQELLHAAIFDVPEILDELLSYPGRPKNGLTGLIVGPDMFGRYSCSGVEVFDVDALRVAVLDKQPGLLKRMLKAASIDEKNTALRYAVQADRVDYMEMIVAAGADIRASDESDEDRTAERGHNRLSSSLLDEAIRAHAAKALRWLIAHGLPVDGVAAGDSHPGRRWTTLHAWVRDAATEEFTRGNINATMATLDVLLAAGARQDILVDPRFSSPKQSPLAYAMYGADSPTTVRTLVERGVRSSRLDAEQREDLGRIMKKASDPVWRKQLEKRGEEWRLSKEAESTEPCLEKRLLEYRSGDEASARERSSRPPPAPGEQRARYKKPNWSDDLVPDEASGAASENVRQK